MCEICGVGLCIYLKGTTCFKIFYSKWNSEKSEKKTLHLHFYTFLNYDWFFILQNFYYKSTFENECLLQFTKLNHVYEAKGRKDESIGISSPRSC